MENLKELIDRKLNNLPEADLEELLNFVELLEQKGRVSPIEDREDALIGLFEGPSDLADRVEELLAQGVAERSGWTWKGHLR